MKPGLFKEVSAIEGNPNWANLISRKHEMYNRGDDIRSEFSRDYNRILHCTAYRRLKRKTQVFFATRNDHVCTRIEHVNHVASVSYTISKYLGLNNELTNAIALGHDLGHAPFGHAGETIIKEIVNRELQERFWHERNSLRFIDKCETLPDPAGNEKNLNLTYAVRDGIISHCGEVDENAIFPRNEFLDLEQIQEPSQYSSYTWEGCVVKIADKIAYLGRDIEDALTLSILSMGQLKELLKILRKFSKVKLTEINNTVLMHNFIIDLCESSTPEKGIRFSEEHLELINSLKSFNYEFIYKHKRLNIFKDYAKLIINSIFNILFSCFHEDNTLTELKKLSKIYPLLIDTFLAWLTKYSDINERIGNDNKLQNEILYRIRHRNDYCKAIIDYISGMTDGFAIRIFNELTGF